jgi:hypothetical protein
MTEIIDRVPSVPVDDEVETFDCPSCGSVVEHDEGVICRDSEELYCLDCMTSCDDCGEYFYYDDQYYPNYCEGCQDDYHMCNRCDDVVHSDDINWVDDGNYSWCSPCTSNFAEWCENCGYYETRRNRCSSSELVHDYSYKPNPRFRRTSLSMEDRSYFGIELEVEANSGSLEDGARFVLKHLNGTDDISDDSLVYLKEDGSLNYGFEIVTHPMTFDFAMNVDWSFLKKLSDSGFRSWNTSTCGLHVHTSRRGFKDKRHLWFFTQLINSHPNQCARLAGRTSDQWSTFSGQKKETSDIVLGKAFARNKYVAVNMCHSASVEIRIFRGSLHPDRIRMAIQFVRSCVEYTRDMTITKASLGGLDWQEYKQYVINNSGMYPELVWYMNEKGV